LCISENQLYTFVFRLSTNKDVSPLKQPLFNFTQKVNRTTVIKNRSFKRTHKMLELKPECERCGRSLPMDSEEAMICSYECTFCKDCVEQALKHVCPNCGGSFEQRPRRMIKLDSMTTNRNSLDT